MPQKDINQEHIKNTSGSPRYGVDSTQMQSNEDSMLWQTAGNIVYEGNGATSQNFATEFADRGIQGFYSSQGSGKRKHLGVQVISDKNPYAPVINGFIHNGAELGLSCPAEECRQMGMVNYNWNLARDLGGAKEGTCPSKSGNLRSLRAKQIRSCAGSAMDHS